MKTEKQTKPRSITALEEEWTNLVRSDDGKQAHGAETANRLINEAAPHDLRTRITEVKNVMVGERRCLIHCTMFIREPNGDSGDEDATEMIETSAWVHPTVAGLYDPSEVIQQMRNEMTGLDHDAEWTKLEILCNTLTEVLKGPLHRKTGDIDLKRTIQEIDWGRLQRALPETYRKARAAAEYGAGIAAVTDAATARRA